MQQKMIQFSGDVSLPAIGQGTWYMGEDASQRKTEVAALRAGIELGLTLIDTAEMYADGGAEKVVGEALIGLRENVFLVSKVYLRIPLYSITDWHRSPISDSHPF
ncbi:aldo/keto reductase, partial [Escherichia coli]